ncbi:SDR family NAD(P)-dependent oxidoreductase [Rhodospirillaceae bacterium SYSU D60014]|uniref:SDR family NAD(P)-dependent oxidoreductase n=1 Tax=Virgifigura deserti TaxID=2268457 RepID=UPI000E67038D
MTVLVTGAAGFIGFHVASALLARGERVVGVDNLNAYYDVDLKKARLARLEETPGFTFHRLDLGDRAAAEAAFDRIGPLDGIVHLAAQAGVRHSLTEPHAYIEANITGHLVILEACRRLPDLKHLVYASSSSVYGGNRKLPFAIEDPVDRPLSLYGATKRADELMSAAYAHLFRVPMTGLRFFTVYGPWGRPDMSAYLFTKAILAGEPIRVFNKGDMRRDFTYIDDIVQGVLAALDHPPSDGGEDAPPHRLYNLGNHRSEPLMRFIGMIEEACGRKAKLDLLPMQPGDVRETFADITAAANDLGFAPRTPIDEGIPQFVAWFREYHGA